MQLTEHAILQTASMIVFPSKVRVSNFLAYFKRANSAFKPVLAGNPCNVTLKTLPLPFSYHMVRSKQSHDVTNHKTNNTKLEHRINVTTSVSTSKVRTSILFLVCSFQTIRREARTISLCKNVCCKRRGTGCKSKTT